VAERNEKQQRLSVEEPSKLEKKLNWFKDAGLQDRLSDGYHGWRVKVGGLAPGGGFAIGPEYSREGLLGGKLDFRAGAQSSARGYQKADLHMTLPKVVSKRLSGDFYAVHHNYPSLNYYGSGPDSAREGRSNYRMEDTAADVTLTVRILDRLRAGVSTGYVWNNVGPGDDSRYISTEKIYSVPGVGEQANFARTGGFIQYDYRDLPGGPRSGGNYVAQFHRYTDQTLGTDDFRRLELEAQQYIPLFNKRRVIALRGKSVMSFTDGDRSVPFYMQPTLGGSDDLRGYRPFRFRGDNLFLMNAEYRWEVFSGLDMALFGDAGKVYNRKSDFDLDHLESSVGFGFRFNARNNVFMRLDVGFSHEGYQVSLKFNNLFRRGPVHTSSSQGDF
jgi:outer membrane protein assembly factor BamA